MIDHQRERLVLSLPALDGATAALLFDLCGQLHAALMHDYGDEMEAHWIAAEPSQPLYAALTQPCRRRANPPKRP